MKFIIIVLRWIAVPIAAFAITYAALLAAAYLSYLFSFTFGYPYEIPVFGSIAAFTLVVSGAIVAPRNINRVAVLHFIIGVLISWRFLTGLTEPDSLAPTYIPIFFTYLSGVIGIVTVYFIGKKQTTNSADQG